MRPADLLKSTPFRLAIIFAALFIISFLAAGTVTYEILKRDLARRLDQTIQDTYSVLIDAYGDHDLTDLVDAVSSHAASTSDHSSVYLLRGQDGKVLAGNIARADVPDGWSTVAGVAIGLPPGMNYRIYSSSVDNQPLIVGMSFEESQEFQEIARSSFGWAAIVVLALAIAGGLILASRIQRRLESIAATMGDVASGKLDARIPLVGSGDDVDQLSLQVNSALERLAALVEGMRQVSTDIAHDLKTPLNRLSMTIEQAIERSGSGSGSAISPYLVRAKEESMHINATFDALLRIAQVEAGARRSRFAKVDLRQCLETIAEIYAEVAADNGQELTLYLEHAGSMYVYGDQELLMQLLVNLIENAIRHSCQGAHITLHASHTGESILVDITDNGPGIPTEERENVFRRLYRLDKSRTTLGTGLGLSLVKAIVDLHHAWIGLSDNHPGLRVTLKFSSLGVRT